MSRVRKTCSRNDADLALIGGGLANSLIAIRLADLCPDSKILIIDSGSGLATREATWSCHRSDLSDRDYAWVQSCIETQWCRQSVDFPKYRREFDIGYLSLRPRSLLREVQRRSQVSVITGEAVEEINRTGIRTSQGRVIRAKATIDGRGFQGSYGISLAYQKFYGLEVKLPNDHGISCPVIMDVTVTQESDYRFVYLLPLSPRQLLIEDTYYSESPFLDKAEIRQRVLDYAAHRGWRNCQELRSEHSVLPIALSVEFDRFWPRDDPVARSGVRAGLFHPTTGYSLPEAIRFANAIADTWRSGNRDLARFSRQYSHDHHRKTAYFRRLNRMLMTESQVHRRYLTFQHFYRMPVGLIRRFYANELRLKDKIRLLIGKPTVPLFSALMAMPERRATTRSSGFVAKPKVYAKSDP